MHLNTLVLKKYQCLIVWFVCFTVLYLNVIMLEICKHPKVDNDVMDVYLVNFFISCQGCRGRDRMVVGFTSTYAISAYHH